MIYLIRDTKNGLIKIGKADNVARRLAQLQTGNASPLFLVAVGPGGYELEKHLHLRLKGLRVRGEWFKLRPWHIAWLKIVLGVKVAWWWRVLILIKK